VASGWQVRRPIRRLNLAAGDYPVQGSLRCGAGRNVGLDDEIANAIEDTSDDPEVAVQKKDTSAAPRKRA
jgi:hypothetical protein